MQRENRDERQRHQGDRGGWGVGRGRDSGGGERKGEVAQVPEDGPRPSASPHDTVYPFHPSPIRPLCPTLHLPILLKLPRTGLCHLQLTNPRLRQGGISRQGYAGEPAKHGGSLRPSEPSRGVGQRYVAFWENVAFIFSASSSASITRRQEGSPFSWPWGCCLVAYMT